MNRIKQILHPDIPYREPWAGANRTNSLKALAVILIYWAVRIFLQVGQMYLAVTNQGASMFDLRGDAELFTQAVYQNQWLDFGIEVFLLGFVLVLLRLFKLPLFDGPPLNKQRLKHIYGIYALGLAVSIVYGMIVSAFDPNFNTENQMVVESIARVLNPFFTFVKIVICAPIIEEILSRGLMMRYLFAKWPVIGAVSGSILFAWLHLGGGSWMDFMPYFIMSVGLTVTYWRSRQLEDSIVYHMTQNLLGFIVMLIGIAMQ